MLAEQGADVIKVESAPKGDLGRNVSVFRNKRSLFHVQHNRGKKSLCVNLRDPRGMALITELIQQVDIVVENFKPGVMANMGLGYERPQRAQARHYCVFYLQPWARPARSPISPAMTISPRRMRA